MFTLRGLLAEANRRYWGGRFPRYHVLNRRIPGGTHGQCQRRRRRILLDVAKHHDGEGLRETLIHEMCRVTAAPDPRRDRSHGANFRAEPMRVAALGEPLAARDCALYELSFERVCFSSLRGQLQDWITGIDPALLRWGRVRITLAHVNALSVRTLDRHYPRLKASFRRCQREAIRDREQQARLRAMLEALPTGTITAPAPGGCAVSNGGLDGT